MQLYKTAVCYVIATWYTAVLWENKTSVCCNRRKLKARANERNAKLALAFHSECSRGSIAQSAVKAEKEVSEAHVVKGLKKQMNN